LHTKDFSKVYLDEFGLDPDIGGLEETDDDTDLLEEALKVTREVIEVPPLP